MLKMGRAMRQQDGYSMAEVVIAVMLFAATVLGISSMVTSGAADVRRGADDSLAASLAAKKIEQVRALPFYKPWDGSRGAQDIDDYYFNTSLSGDWNAQQLSNPVSVEDYGSIPGASRFRRTTAIQYQVAGESGLTPAVMASDWVPSDPATGQTDRQTTSSDTGVSSLIIEVSVYFRVNGQEVVFRQRALAGDMIIAGGSSIPVLLINNINPTYGDSSHSNRQVEVYVTSTASITGGDFEVRLWYPGREDIVGTNTTVENQSQINTHFDLSTPGLTPGVYHLSVYWRDKGWIDRSYRECFTLLQPPPTIASVNNFNWGHRGQSIRQVTINGDNLENPMLLRLVGPADEPPANQYVCPSRGISSNTRETIVADFDLTSVPTSAVEKYWNVEVTTFGGKVTSDADGKRVLMNPKPRVTSVSCSDGSSFYRKKNYSSVTIYGRYFYGADTGILPTVRLTKSGLPDVSGSRAGVFSVAEYGDADTRITMNVLDLRLQESGGGPSFLYGNPSGSELGNWKVMVKNPDNGESVENVYANVTNAPIAVTGGTSTGGANYFDAAMSLNGAYFQAPVPGKGNGTKVEYWYGGTCYDPLYNGAPTVEGTPVVSGNYAGTGQAITGLTTNLIDIPVGTGAMKVTDLENNQTANYSFSVQAWAPTINAQSTNPATRGVSFSERDGQNHTHKTLCTLDGSYTVPWSHDCYSHFLGHTHHFYHQIRIRGKGMYGTSVVGCSGRDFWGSEVWSWYGEKNVTPVTNRAGKSVYVLTSEFHSCDPWARDNNRVRIRNSVGDTSWVTWGDWPLE